MNARHSIRARYGLGTAAGCLRWALVSAALSLGAHPAYLHAKAELAQWLLWRSWEAARSGQPAPPPWPWADTRPVARLTLDRLAIDEIILAGDSGRTLAFGPGWAESSTAPGHAGTVIVSGHRDTHFNFLRNVAAGDRLRLESAVSQIEYRVVNTAVVDSRTQRLATDSGDRLVLVTCWPFDALTAGGPLRYVVEAERIDAI